MGARKENGGTPIARSNEDRCEQSRADHELFLQAFEKPTQIYRYLKIRNKLSPTFLNRNLSYMKQRCTRTNEKRKNFKVNSIYENLKELQGREEGVKGAFMTITFLGFYDKKRNEKAVPAVKLDLSLLNLTHKKRKESSTPLAVVPLGSAEIPVNPSEANPPSKAPALSISSKHLEACHQSGARVRTSTLVFRIECETGGGGSEQPEENIEPAAKRRKFGRGSYRSAVAELTITDKHSRLQLTEGEYELIMYSDDEDTKFSPRKSAAWEFVDIENTDRAAAREFTKFRDNCTLKFRLSWSTESAGSLVERPRPLMPRDNGQDSTYLRREKVKKENKTKNLDKPTRIVYQFLFNNNSRQLTEAREDLHCPWCGLNCMVLYSLLKHLKLSHPRFLFTYVPLEDEAQIDVSVSELFDSTYVGNPHDMISQPPGYAFSRNGPVQRTSITIILVFKPKRSLPSLSEFLEQEDNENGHFEAQRPFVSGHNRLYHNSTTALPIPPHAINNNTDLDEEDRPDPPWLLIKTSKMIDDFTDVNEGEKQFMKIWNHHVQKYTYVGDCQMPEALNKFIAEKGVLVIQKGVFSNFILHLVNLFEFGVVGPAHIFTAMTKLQLLIQSRGLQHDLAWTRLRNRLLLATRSAQDTKAVRNNFSGIFKK